MPSAATPPPDRGALSGPLAGLSFIGGIGAANALADVPYPRPGTDPSQVRQYFTQNAGPTRLSATGQAISAACLARFTASVARDRKSTRLNSSHVAISYAVFCLKKKKKRNRKKQSLRKYQRTNAQNTHQPNG